MSLFDKIKNLLSKRGGEPRMYLEDLTEEEERALENDPEFQKRVDEMWGELQEEQSRPEEDDQ